MSQENPALVREALDAYKRGGMDAVFDYYAEDVVFVVDPGFPEAGTFRGKDAVRAYADQWAETFEEFDWEIEDLIEVSMTRRLRSSRSGAVVVGAARAWRCRSLGSSPCGLARPFASSPSSIP
jgi:ketosteroid isomerase-like protein